MKDLISKLVFKWKFEALEKRLGLFVVLRGGGNADV